VGVFLDTKYLTDDEGEPIKDENGAYIPPDGKPYFGYVEEMVLLASTSFAGTLINIWLYIDDKKNRGGILNRVHGKESVTGVIKAMDEFNVDGVPSTVDAPGSTKDGEYDPSDPVEAPHAGA
jgi:hypothetical protein